MQEETNMNYASGFHLQVKNISFQNLALIELFFCFLTLIAVSGCQKKKEIKHQDRLVSPKDSTLLFLDYYVGADSNQFFEICKSLSKKRKDVTRVPDKFAYDNLGKTPESINEYFFVFALPNNQNLIFRINPIFNKPGGLSAIELNYVREANVAYAGRPTINEYQINYLVNLYTTKYGKPDLVFPGSTTPIEWRADERIIRVDYYEQLGEDLFFNLNKKNTFSYIFNITYFDKKFLFSIEKKVEEELKREKNMEKDNIRNTLDGI